MEEINKTYWDKLYKSGKTGWDIGYVSTPLRDYFDQLSDTSIKILVPGAGKGYEVEYLFNTGFKNVYYLDYSEEAIDIFQKRCPEFPIENILTEDFFDHDSHYDLIIELTFFTSIIPENREALAKKMYTLLKPGGKYIGVFFNDIFGYDHPPFGAIKENYIELMKDLFNIKTLDIAYNSIKPRKGRELFFIFEKV